MSERDYEIGYGKPPRHSRFKQGEPSANPRGRPRKNMTVLLVEGLNKKVTVTENGRRRKVTLREAITSQLINQSASADLRATKMLLDLIKDAERQTAAAAAAPEAAPPFTKADEEVVATLIERLRHQILTEIKAAEASRESTQTAPATPDEE
jgi:uncharacterized protein DUF5681